MREYLTLINDMLSVTDGIVFWWDVNNEINGCSSKQCQNKNVVIFSCFLYYLICLARQYILSFSNCLSYRLSS